jgi:hypothetical protein
MNGHSAVTGTRKQIKEMADGTVRVAIDIDPEFKKTFMTEFGEIDTKVVIALMVPEHRMIQQESQQSNDGKFYQTLHKVGFFIVPAVCQAVGTDDQFLDWMRKHPRSATGKLAGGESGPIVPAHVRRVANGSGTGVKPPFSAIPLTDQEHRLQHQKGESAVHTDGKEWFDKKRVQYLTEWVKSRLYEHFNIESLTELPAADFIAWAKFNNLMNYIPQAWRSAA